MAVEELDLEMTLEELDLERFEAIADEWDALAAAGDTPFMTSAWLASWWRGRPEAGVVARVMRDGDGRLLAGSCFRTDGGALRGAVGVHTNDWGAVAIDAGARRRFWVEVAAAAPRSAILEPLPADADQAAAAAAGLREAGFRVVEERGEASPVLDLPGSLEELLAGRSRNLRSQVGRRRRRLEKEGELSFRRVTGGPGLEADLESFLELEGAGWKGKAGTAINADPAVLTIYRGFAERAAAEGSLRLYLLELDGRPIGADYGCVFNRCGYLIKTGFDEDLGRFAPGLVLRAAVIESSIEEGLERYDFLGGPDEYKMRWTDSVRERVSVRAWRGPGAALPYAWRAAIRPRVKRARDLVREARRGRGGAK